MKGPARAGPFICGTRFFNDFHRADDFHRLLWHSSPVLPTFRLRSTLEIPELAAAPPPDSVMNDLFDKSRRSARVSDARRAEERRVIAIRGAREHNLKGIDVEIPRDKLVVFTGLSGSGKSSLAFDTIYAEGQRRYVELLSAYARQFLEMMQKPDVDQIDGLSPAISIEQKTTSRNPRSTVGTVTEIYDYMRLLWARVGVPYSPATGLPIESQTVSQMVDRVMALPEGTRCYLLAPVVRGRKGEYRKELAEYLKKGYQRVKIDGKFYEIAEVPALDKKFTHDIDVVVDRIVVRADVATRLADSFEQALKLADGLAVIELADASAASPFPPPLAGEGQGRGKQQSTARDERPLSTSPPQAGERADRARCEGADPTRHSRCVGRTAHGLLREIRLPGVRLHHPRGRAQTLFIQQPVRRLPEVRRPRRRAAHRRRPDHPRQGRDLAQGRDRAVGEVVEPVLPADAGGARQALQVHARQQWKDLPKKTQDAILYGSGDDDIKFSYDDGMRAYQTRKPFEGVITNLERRWKETESDWAREELQKYFTDVPCDACKGFRLKPEALCVKVGGNHIGDVAEMSVKRAGEWFTELPKRLNAKQTEIAVRVLKEIRERLKFLVDVGLEYLTLARASGTLSGGESQRIRLASQIGSGLTGVLYVLDEPSIGLHQRDNERLLVTLQRLRDLGNTVIVVEHDEDAIRTADHVLDIGPGAGIHGGEIIAEGQVDDLIGNPDSITGKYLSGELCVAIPERRPKNARRAIKVVNARGHNLKKVTAEIPLGLFTCVTGVSAAAASPRC